MIHGDAGIVGDGRKPRYRRSVAGLDERVLNEGEACLLDLRHAELRLGDNLHVNAGKQLAELSELAAIPAREHHPLPVRREDGAVAAHASPASAARCLSMISLMPLRASSSIACSSSIRNA